MSLMTTLVTLASMASVILSTNHDKDTDHTDDFVASLINMMDSDKCDDSVASLKTVMTLTTLMTL